MMRRRRFEIVPSEEFARCGSKPPGTPNIKSQRRQHVHCNDVAHFRLDGSRYGNENKAQYTLLESVLVVVRVYI